MTTLRSSTRRLGRSPAVPLLLVLLPAAGCVGAPGADEAFQKVTDFGPAQECLARAMYFESNRSSEDGMLAVGTVVMNRVKSGEYPSDVCSVVSEPGQFAPGLMTRDMGAGKELAMRTAEEVLSGKRHPGVKDAMYFHTAGMHFPYRNMNYTAIAGGNAFYEKVSRRMNPDFDFSSQADVRAAQAAGNAGSAIDAMRDGKAAAPAPAAVALTAARPERAAEKSPFLALWQNITRPRQAAAAERAPTADAGAKDGKGGRVVAATASSGNAGSGDGSAGLPGVQDGVRGAIDNSAPRSAD
ncbi:cell wall hydrolase [Jiella sp. M17.18]|uniref:cell wall hydrolase n=1 Tax=Jiella sp. M17.18 TaxID=3234247 RepID=UPI0034DF8231